MPTHTITISYNDGNDTIAQAVAITADSEASQEIAVASDAADLEVDVFIPDGEIKAFILLADQTLSLEYNDSSGTHGDITLTADEPVYFYIGAPFALADVMAFVGADLNVTKFFVTNDDATDATTLFIKTLYDGTP